MLMELRQLNVLQWRSAHVPVAANQDASDAQHLFRIDTSQRQLAVLAGREALDLAQRQFPNDGALEHYEGTDAYAFLLRFACGLESRLVAETEIFGQIKQAWRVFSERGSELSKQLSPWIQHVFQDAKEIRAQYLGSLGSSSYGSQVRRLLGDEPDSGPTLLVGAGQLAQSVAPWLTGSELWLWNRTGARARAGHGACQAQPATARSGDRELGPGGTGGVARRPPDRDLRAPGCAGGSSTGRCLARAA